MSKNRYFINKDYLDKVFRYYNFIVAVVLIYGYLIQFLSGNDNLYFLIFTLIYLAWHIAIGFINNFGKEFPDFQRKSFKYYRFFFNVFLTSILYYLSKESIIYFLLFIPWISSLNLYLIDEKNNKSKGMLGTLICLTLFVSIQLIIFNEKDYDLVAKDYGSIFLKNIIILSTGYFSYWFWKHRKIEQNYFTSIKNLLNAGHDLTSKSNFKNVIKAIAQNAYRTLEADIVQITPYDDRKGEFLLPYTEGEFFEVDKKRTRFKEDDVQYIILKKGDLFVSDAQQNEITARKGEYKYQGESQLPFVFREKIVSSAGVRLIVDEIVYGIMFINYRTKKEFLQKEKEIINTYSKYAALAIKNIIEKEGLVRKLNFSVSKIFDIKEKLNIPHIKRESSIIKLVLNDILSILDEKLGYFSMYNPSTELLTMTYSCDEYNKYIGRETGKKTGLIGEAVRKGELRLMRNKDSSSPYRSFGPTSPDKNVKSAIAIPLKLEDHILGVFMIESDFIDNFSDLDIQIVNSLVEQASIAIKSIRQYEENLSASKFISHLRGIDKLILDSDFNLSNALGFILKKALEITEADRGNIPIKINERTLRIEESTEQSNKGEVIKIDKSISGLAVLQENTVYIKNIKEKKYYEERFLDFLGKDIHSELVVPLIAKEKILGVINIESSKIDAFSGQQIQEIETLANQTALAIYIARLIDGIDKRRNEWIAIQKINEAILDSKLNLSDTLHVILNEGLKLINKSFGEIILFQKDKKLVVRRSTSPKFENRVLDIDKTISGLAIKKELTIYIPSLDNPNYNIDNFQRISADIYFPCNEELELYHPHPEGPMKSELVVPLFVDEEVIGVFNIESKEEDDFDLEFINLIENLTIVSSLAIQNAQRYEELKQARDTVLKSVDKEILKVYTQMSKS